MKTDIKNISEVGIKPMFSAVPISDVFNEDNVSFMKRFPDAFFDLGIVDPPYGIGQNWTKDRNAKFYNHRNDFNNQIPGEEYFSELFRVTKHQFIWGANYYWNYLNPSNNLIFWDKGKDAFTQLGSAGEIAWTSITSFPLVKIALNWNGCIMCERVERIHPHQKPIKLYDWTLKHYAKPGWKILDTHLGSGSCRIASHKAGFDFWGVEKDKLYFDEQNKRFELYLNPLLNMQNGITDNVNINALIL